MSTLKSLRSDFQSVVEFAKMDLAEKPYPLGCGCSPASSNKKYYPTLYVNRQDKIDLPMKGKATIEYRLRSKTARQDEDGKMTESADIEVISIDPIVEPVAKPKPGAAVPTVVAQFRSAVRDVVEFARGDQVAKWLPSQRPSDIRQILPALSSTTKPGRGLVAELTGRTQSRQDVAAKMIYSRQSRDRGLALKRALANGTLTK